MPQHCSFWCCVFVWNEPYSLVLLGRRLFLCQWNRPQHALPSIFQCALSVRLHSHEPNALLSLIRSFHLKDQLCANNETSTRQTAMGGAWPLPLWAKKPARKVVTFYSDAKLDLIVVPNSETVVLGWHELKRVALAYEMKGG